jgi:ABC-type dipeptide/oligopeptide/nickel transport system ATPase subunit
MTPLLDIQHVGRTYSMGGLFGRHRVLAVDDVSFTLEQDRPEIFAVIGESGSGKTTLARMILKMVPPTSGSIIFEGADIAEIESRRDRLAFMKQVQPIFQNPFESFNPLKRVDRYLFMTARRFVGAKTTADIERHSDRALKLVGLSLHEVKGRFPHELSGGQLQRIAVARALISEPKLIIADEPVSMVDASRRIEGVHHLHHARLGDRLLHQRSHHHHAEGQGCRKRQCAGRARPPAAPLFHPPQGICPVSGSGRQGHSCPRRHRTRTRRAAPRFHQRVRRQLDLPRARNPRRDARSTRSRSVHMCQLE